MDPRKTDRRKTNRGKPSGGFTLLETAISTVLLGILVTSVFSIALETASFVGDNEVDSVAQAEANRAFERLSDILRKTGRTEVGGVQYPRVIDGGTGLEFLVLEDIDGNGYAFDGATSALEWSPTVYAIRLSPDGSMNVHAGGSPVFLVGRFVRDVHFRTVKESAALHLKEVLVHLEVERTLRAGSTVSHTLDGSIHMRN